MIALLEIKKAIVAKLKAGSPDVSVVAEEVQQGFKKPAFFVKLLPVTRTPQGLAHVRRVITVLIQYYSPDETHIESLTMQDKLESLFSPVLAVGDRHLTTYDMNSDTNDKVLELIFNLDFIDSIDETKVYGYEEYDTMQELEVKEEF